MTVGGESVGKKIGTGCFNWIELVGVGRVSLGSDAKRMPATAAMMAATDKVATYPAMILLRSYHGSS